MERKWQKFIAFEWLLFVIIGLFWAAAMSLPLYLSGDLKKNALFWRNFSILCGPYLAYFVVRGVYLLCRSLRWAYLVSNFFFRSEKERKFANEWGFFVILFIFWPLIAIGPLYYMHRTVSITGGFAVIVLILPYFLYWFLRWASSSVRWAIRMLMEK